MTKHHTTRADRAWRTRRLIRPMKRIVRQPDGTERVQYVEITVKKPKPSRAARRKAR